MTYRDLLVRHGGTVAFGFCLAFLSSFGQTFFIALSGPDIRATFGLSNGGFGLIYSTATLASGLLMIWAGGILDRVSTLAYAGAGLVGLGLAAAGLSLAPNALFLGLALFALRLFGQGMLSHAAVTSTARLPQAVRGRAVGIATLGFSTGEALLPSIGVAAIAGLGWVGAWRSVTVLLLLVAVLLALRGLFARKESGASEGAAASRIAPEAFRRRDVLTDWRFLIFIPTMIGPAAIVTGYFFHQTILAERQGWSLETLALSFSAYAAAGVISTMGTGYLVDRFGATRLCRFHLLGLGAASLILLGGGRPVEAPIFFGLMGLTTAANGVVVPAVLAEIFGTRHLGAIRALSAAVMVVGSATTPGLMGYFLDTNVPLGAIGVGCAAYVVCASLANVLLHRRKAEVKLGAVTAG